MSKIAVICAYNLRNSGMYSVDLGAQHFFKQLGLKHDLFVTQGRARVGALRYRLIRDLDALRDYDTIVYWGDFLNNPMWGRHDYAERDVNRHGVASTEQAYAHWQRLYLPNDSSLPSSTRVLALGGCFIGMEDALANTTVATALRQFVARCSAVVARDPASFANLSAATEAHPHVSLGFDCASLMHTRPPTRWRGPYFAHSFGRSLMASDAAALVRRIEQLTGLRGVSIPWLKRGWPKRFTHTRFVANLALMRHARLCVTDTYHFALNSMSQGSLPMCVVRDEPAQASTLNERKKSTLLGMVGLAPSVLHLPGQTMQPVSADQLELAAQTVADQARSTATRTDWRDGYVERQQQFRAQIRSHIQGAASPTVAARSAAVLGNNAAVPTRPAVHAGVVRACCNHSCAHARPSDHACRCW